MTINTVGQQAKVYLFDLDNCAKEFGFKADEGWELSLASREEKVALEKQYYPTISAKVFPEILAEIFHLVESGLKKVKSGIMNSMDSKNLANRELQYLVAYNPKRTIR